MEKLFAGEEDEMVDTDSTPATTTTDTDGHISKKELKERKKQEKADRKAAKALRKQQHHQQPAVQQKGLTVNQKAEADAATRAGRGGGGAG